MFFSDTVAVVVVIVVVRRQGSMKFELGSVWCGLAWFLYLRVGVFLPSEASPLFYMLYFSSH